MAITNSKTIKTALKNGNKKASYTATVVRFGNYNCEKDRNRHHSDQTVLLCNVEDECGKIVAEHTWVSDRGFENIESGDVISFSASISTYYSRHKRKIKHSFKNLSNIRKTIKTNNYFEKLLYEMITEISTKS